MKKRRSFIKIILESPVLIKIMCINSLVILVIVVIGLIFDLETTLITVVLNLTQIILFFKSRKQLNKKQAELEKTLEEFNKEIEEVMALLIMDEEFNNNILKLIDFAQNNPFTMDDLLDMMNGDLKSAGDTEGYFFVTSTGIKIVHCIEKQVKGDVRYCSIGLSNTDNLPHPALVIQIIEILRFKNRLSDCIVDIEKAKDNKPMAISIREMIENE